ncbi:hypothetical protein [Streptomyces sp. NPDC018031]|uniref:hypothetical protein n=1 Tax=Streptomyces sp. NPDC018031 TaxID=3365033 RepID=UPI003797A965
MFQRRKTTQNPEIAKQMRALFAHTSAAQRADPELMAKAYGAHFYSTGAARKLARQKNLLRAHFHIGLNTPTGDLSTLTKRSALVADTLLLSHGDTGARHCVIPELRDHSRQHPVSAHPALDSLTISTRDTTQAVHMKCPDLPSLGRWITDAEPLLRAGLAWYLPTYWVTDETTWSPGLAGGPGVRRSVRTAYDMPSPLDFLVRHGRVVGEFDASPVASQVVRPVLRIDLPFIEGVTLRDFSEITVQEFASYAQLRLFLRDAFLNLDQALGADQAEREMIRIGHAIESEIRGVQAQMATVRRRRAVAVTGATIGTVGATLVGVYGPALQEALTILGVAGAGGVWGVVQGLLDGGPRTLRENRWYYVWSLAKRSDRYGF